MVYPKPCKRCEKTYQPLGKYTKGYCDDCKRKRREMRQYEGNKEK